MTGKNEFDDLLDMGDTSDLDNILLSDNGEDDLVDRMDEQQEKKVESKNPWMQDLKEHWYWYLILALSFLLTETTAIYLGLVPHLIADPNHAGKQLIEWNTDIGHLLTALVYMLLFPSVTEVAFDRAWKKFGKREPGNIAQMWTMITAIVISAVSMLGTGISGFYVVFATLGSVGFIELPHGVQTWLIVIVPALLTAFGILHGIYKSKSRMEKLNRLVDHRLEKAQLSENLRNKITEQKVKRAISNSARRSYIKAVGLGLLSQEEAEAGLAAGKSLVQLEKELNRDLTGEGIIGNTSGLRPAPRAALPSPRPASKEYTLDELLAEMGLTKEEAARMLEEYGLTDPAKAYGALLNGEYIPQDMSIKNFEKLFREIMGSTVSSAPKKLGANGSGAPF